jgi:hypothetical protein
MTRISWGTADFNKILKKYNFQDVLNRWGHSHAIDCILLKVVQFPYYILNQTWICGLDLTNSHFITITTYIKLFWITKVFI